MKLTYCISVFVITYLWLTTEKTPRHIVVLCGSAALLLGNVFTFKEAFHYVSVSTLLLLAGFFVAVEILSAAGFFQWLAAVLVHRFKSHPGALLVVLPFLAGGLSMIVNNITVMVFMTTLTLHICRHIPLKPVPLIVAEVCCANMMGAATLIGAPPNLLMANTLGYGFNRVAIHMAPLALASTAVFMTVHFFQNRLAVDPGSSVRPKVVELTLRQTIRADVETLLFFLGLFILVGSLEHVGVFQRLARQLSSIHQPVLLMLTVLWVSAVVSALVDNIPLALAMGYLIKTLQVLDPSFPSGILVWAALIGLTLGGNMTPIGAPANVVAYGIVETQGTRIGWIKWARLTVPGTLSALGVVSFLVWLKFKLGWY